jgi:hypothetical protein
MSVEVSMFRGVLGTKPTNVKLSDVLNDIRCGAYEAQVRPLRELSASDPIKYDGEKKKLPAFTMSGTCSDRKTPVLHSNVLQVDLDDLRDNLSAIRQKLPSDPYVCFAFLSPSGEGLKIGLRIDGKRHRESFAAAESYFSETYGIEIDPSVKDRLRLCFVSHDPELWINESPKILPVLLIPPKGELFEGGIPEGDVSEECPPYDCEDGVRVCPEVAASAALSTASERAALGAPLDEKVRGEIDRAIEFGEKSTRQNNEASFRACLCLIQIRSVEDLSGMSQAERIYFAEAWHRHLTAKGRVTKPKTHYFNDIFSSTKNAKRKDSMNVKNPVPLAWELAQSQPLPPEAAMFDGDEIMQRLIALCFQIHRICDGGQWFIARNKVSELMGLDSTAARDLSENFNVLVSCGILEIVTPADNAKRQATTYRYVEQSQLSCAAEEEEQPG